MFLLCSFCLLIGTRGFSLSSRLQAPAALERRLVDCVSALSMTRQEEEESFPLIGSLEVLALAVSLFFAASVMLTGDALLPAAPPTSKPLVVIDADALLREDFQREGSSVEY
jgi:hypothetical protein